MRILITGGAGFIGSHFVRYSLEKHPEHDVVVLDKLTYAGRTENLHDVLDSVRFIHGDVCLPGDVDKAIDGCNMVFNFAAESHVDRSISGPGDFIQTNIVGTFNLLEAVRSVWLDGRSPIADRQWTIAARRSTLADRQA